MTPRKRSENTNWWNDGPITDEHEALQVLKKEWRGPDPIYLSLKAEQPEICQELHRQGDGGRASSCYIEYLEIDPKLAEQLIKESYVAPMRIPHMGYTETVRDKLVLTRTGEHRLETLNREKERLAQSLPVAGEHSKFSSIFELSKSEREHGRRGGKLYFEFVTPIKERVRVYPDTKEVLKLEPEKV